LLFNALRNNQDCTRNLRHELNLLLNRGKSSTNDKPSQQKLLIIFKPGARPQLTIRHHAAVSTIVNDNICEASFSLHSARNLELAAEDSD